MQHKQFCMCLFIYFSLTSWRNDFGYLKTEDFLPWWFEMIGQQTGQSIFYHPQECLPAVIQGKHFSQHQNRAFGVYSFSKEEITLSIQCSKRPYPRIAKPLIIHPYNNAACAASRSLLCALAWARSNNVATSASTPSRTSSVKIEQVRRSRFSHASSHREE